jgi:hypothetical protein
MAILMISVLSAVISGLFFTCPKGTHSRHPSLTQGKPSVHHLRQTSVVRARSLHPLTSKRKTLNEGELKNYCYMPTDSAEEAKHPEKLEKFDSAADMFKKLGVEC